MTIICNFVCIKENKVIWKVLQEVPIWCWLINLDQPDSFNAQVVLREAKFILGQQGSGTVTVILENYGKRFHRFYVVIRKHLLDKVKQRQTIFQELLQQKLRRFGHRLIPLHFRFSPMHHHCISLTLLQRCHAKMPSDWWNVQTIKTVPLILYLHGL